MRTFDLETSIGPIEVAIGRGYMIAFGKTGDEEYSSEWNSMEELALELETAFALSSSESERVARELVRRWEDAKWRLPWRR